VILSASAIAVAVDIRFVEWQPPSVVRSVLQTAIGIALPTAWIVLAANGHNTLGFWIFVGGTALWLAIFRPRAQLDLKTAPPEYFDEHMRQQVIRFGPLGAALLAGGIYLVAIDSTAGGIFASLLGLGFLYVGVASWAFLRAGGGGYEAFRKTTLAARLERGRTTDKSQGDDQPRWDGERWVRD
jgi:hypothetical protein